MANESVSGRILSEDISDTSFRRDPCDPHGPLTTSLLPEFCREHQVPDQRRSSSWLRRSPSWGPFRTRLGRPRDNASTSRLQHSSSQSFFHSNHPQQLTTKDRNHHLSPSHPYAPNTRFARHHDRRNPDLERKCNPKVSDDEYRQFRDGTCSIQKLSCINRNRIDISCSTTRSNSGSRYDNHCYEELHGHSRNGSGDAAIPTSELGILHGAQPRGDEQGIWPLQTNRAAAAAVAADNAAARAVPNISEMTEAEVRVYALQMQSLTQVLLCNMKCLYCTARAEIDRKDQRIAAQEREITSLKSILVQARGDR